jgi:hypothetical protein
MQRTPSSFGGSSRRGLARIDRTIPRFPAFRAAREQLVKEQLGGAWQSFLQRGNWRMLFPFPAQQQQQTTAAELVESPQQNRPSVVLRDV